MENMTATVRATVAFPNLTKPETPFNGGEAKDYTIQLANLSDRATEKLEELGVKVKFKDDDYNRGRFVQAKSKYPIVHNGKQVVIVDTDGNVVNADLIGPGSVVRATVGAYSHRMSGQYGNGLRVYKLVVEELETGAVTNDVVDEQEEVL